MSGQETLARFASMPAVVWLRAHRDRVTLIAIGVLLIAGLVEGILLTQFPGLQYDESLFVNAATTGGVGSTSAQFVFKRFHGIPVLLMTYIGAFKAWVFTPIFAVFGVSVESIRIPMVIVFVLAVAVTALFVRRYTGPWLALVAVLVLISDPVYSLMARNDWGPVGFAGLFRVVALYAALRLLESRRLGWAWLLSVALSVGLFNKLDFGVFAGAFGAALLVVYWRGGVEVLRRLTWRLVAPLLLLVAAIIFCFVYMYLPSPAPENQLGFFDALVSRINLISLTFQGSTLSQYMTGVPLRQPDIALPLAVAMSVLAVVFWITTSIAARLTRPSTAPRTTPNAPRTPRNRDVRPRVLAFVIVLGIFELLGLTLTPQVSGPHHVSAIWPVAALALVFSIDYLLRFRPSRSPIVIGVATLAVVVTLASQVSTGVEMDRAFTNPADRSSIWSDEPERVAALLSEEANSNGPRVVVTADWGVGNQIAALADPHAHIVLDDTWGAFVSRAARHQAIQAADLGLAGTTFFLVDHTSQGQVMAGSTDEAAQFMTSCVAAGGSVSRIYEGEHVAAYRVTC